MGIGRIINLDRITSVQVVTKDDRVYLVFKDGKHNLGYRVNSLEIAQQALITIETRNLKWWRVYDEPVEVTFKKED